MRILITGITGFVGSNLVRSLGTVQEVEIYGHSRDPKQGSLLFKKDRVKFLRTITASDLDDARVDVIIHLAGIAHDLSNKYQPEDYYRVNESYTRELYGHFLACSASKFIYLSSIKAVADIADQPVSEMAQAVPQSHYGKSKRKAEEFIEQHNLPPFKKYYILRPCMIHGPGNKGNLNLLYEFVRTGLPFPLGAFSNKRSFLNIENFNFLVKEFIFQGLPSGIYHLADNGFLSTTDVVRIISNAVGSESRVLSIPRKLLTVFFYVVGRKKMFKKLTENMMVSNDKVIRTIGKPLPVDIEKGIFNTIRSFDGVS